jgi:hypothetical protein
MIGRVVSVSTKRAVYKKNKNDAHDPAVMQVIQTSLVQCIMKSIFASATEKAIRWKASYKTPGWEQNEAEPTI